MATIIPTPVSGDFNTALFNFLKTPGIEGFEPFVYTDSVGIPTLGVGYALLAQNPATNSWESINLTLLQNTVGLTATQFTNLSNKLQDAANALNKKPGATNPFPVWKPGLPASANILDWTMTDDQALSLFKEILPTYQSRVKTWLGNDAIYNSLLGSQEMMVLVSLAFNGYMGKGKSPMLHDAILSGDRAKAWYELRYATPGNNKARYYAQAALFGLYESGNSVVSDADARAAYRVYTQHSTSMLAYDAAHQNAS